ncbi:MAG TPA: hypothetical protein ENN65_06215 [Candidatus Hydrogenedentes bacterium]|nr:hypothetical protein [Candidatus Hydrogenedentota bacterium]
MNRRYQGMILASWKPLGVLLVTGVMTTMGAVAVNPCDYGAVGDGVADDTVAVQRAVNESDKGRVYFPRGVYRITDTIDIDLATLGVVNLAGAGGGARVLMAGPGPTFRFRGNHRGTAAPESFTPEVSDRERGPSIVSLEIVGAHPEADGIAFIGTVQASVHGALIREVRHGLHFVERNRNITVDASHIYHCSGVGIFFDRVNLHQANITGCHISYCKGGGVRVLGGEVRNLQITGNDIEYNYDLDATASADVWIDMADGSIEEGTIASNTIQARPSPNGANIRFEAAEKHARIGLWTISGNLIGSQTTNIHLKNVTGIAVTGNHIYTGAEHALLLDGARHVVVSGNSMDQEHNRGRDMANGVRIVNCDGVLLQGNLLSDAHAGTETDGGAVAVVNSRETMIANNQIFEPRHCGIYVENSRNTTISNCMVLHRTGDNPTHAAIEVIGNNPGTVIRDTRYHPGIRGGILAPETAILRDNIPAAAMD